MAFWKPDADYAGSNDKNGTGGWIAYYPTGAYLLGFFPLAAT
jgi:hypothetical protein